MYWIWSNADKLADITTLITLVCLLIALIFTRRQVRLAFGASAINIFEQIYADLNSKEARRNRRFAYNCNLSPKRMLANELAHKKVESVCVSLDHVGVLLTNKLLPKGPARRIYFDMYVDVFIRCWERLKDYVLFMRKQRTPQHYRNFEALAAMAKE